MMTRRSPAATVVVVILLMVIVGMFPPVLVGLARRRPEDQGWMS